MRIKVSILNISKIEFDPRNEIHRKHCLDFLQGKKLPSSIGNFKLLPPYISVADMMKSKITEYYLAREFNEV